MDTEEDKVATPAEQTIEFLDGLNARDFHSMDPATFIRLSGAMADAQERFLPLMDVVRETNMSWIDVLNRVIEVDGARYLGTPGGLFRLANLVLGPKVSNRTLADIGTLKDRGQDEMYDVDIVRGIITLRQPAKTRPRPST